MTPNMTKAELIEELKTARQRIAELERVSVPAGREALFSRVFQVSPSLMALSEIGTGKYVEVNEAFLNTLGFTREEVIGKTATELNLFVDLNQRDELLKRMQQQGYLRDEFVSVRTKAGEIRYGIFTGEFVEVQKQKLALIAVNDITERKQAEEGIRLAESRYRALIENAPDGIVLIGTDFKFKYASPSAGKIFGYDLNTDLELSPDALTHPDDLPRVLGVLSDLLEHPERTPTIQYRFLHKAGDWRWIESTFSNLLALSSVEAIVINFRDITERKQTEMALQASEENYRKLAETSDSAIAVLDRDGRILYANPVSLRVWQEPQFVGKMIHDFFTKEIADGYLAVVRRVIEEQTTDTNELEVTIKGRVMWFHATMSPLKNSDGSIDTLLLNAMDITERKRVETDLAEAQRMAKLGNWHFDISSNTTIWSDELYRIFDVDKTDFDSLDELFFSRVHSEDRERVEAVYQYTLTNGECFSLDYRVLTRGAVEKYIHEFGYALRDPAGQVTGLLGVAQDVTDKVESAARVYESEMRFHQIAETIPEMFWIFDHAKQSLVYTSPAYEDIWGYAVKNLYEGSRLYIEAVHPEDRGLMSAVLERQARGEATDTQYRIVQFNGSVRWIHDRSFPVFDEANGTVLRTIGIAADITERRLVGEVLRDNEERLRLSLKAAKQGLYDLNVQTGKAIVNHEYAEMLGYDPETFVETNQAWIERLHPDDAEITSQVYSNYISGRIPEYHVEFRQRTKDGNWKWILSIGKVVEYDDVTGKPLRMLGTHTDITDRKQSEQFLRESEERYRLLSAELEKRVQQRTAEVRDLYENAPTGYHSLNSEGRIVTINQTELEWLGYTREEVIGRPFTDFVTPETTHVFIENFPVFKQKGRVNNLEFQLLCKDDSSFPVLVNATAVTNEAGDFLMSRSTVFDNTERKQAELALREREDIYRALFQSANDAIFMLSPDGIILQANPSSLELLGYTILDEILGKRSGELIADSDQADSNNTMKRLLAGEHLPVYERIFVRKDGTLIETEVNQSLIRDEFGDPKFIQSVVRDISIRKQAENALRESEEQNRLLFEESPDAVVLFDPNGRVVRINRAFGTITGRDDKQFIGHFVMELGILPRQLMEALSVSVAEAFKQNSKFAVLEFKLKHTSGEVRDINARIFTLNLHGEPHYLASMHDITTSKRAEETLRLANAEIERSLRLKDEFLANMSHELRTPLNAILGISESLLEQISGSLNDKQIKYLQTVLESAEHLLELINDILDLAKINAGRVDLDINKTDIRTVSNASLRMIRELAQKKSVAVEFEIDKAVTMAWVDERRLKQMLVNLLSNAVKFTQPSGKIGLEVRGDPQDGILTFTIWDTGIGIEEKDLRLLFQPFIQLDAGLSRGSQGTGLGLVLVSQMARLHGGSVSVESTPGKGSRFSIFLPWIMTEDTMPQISSPTKESTSLPQNNDRAIILLVEDTVEVTMLIHDYLESHGYAVVTAKDGYEALSRVKEKQPDLILMDVMMPELDGLETTRRLRSDLGLAEVPIIALTALAMTGDRERCLAAGMNDYLSKPVRLKELLGTIEKHLHQGGPDE